VPASDAPSVGRGAYPETGALADDDEQSFIDRVRKVGAVSKGSTMHFTGPGRRPKGWKP
jgi:hypothetical protein